MRKIPFFTILVTCALASALLLGGCGTDESREAPSQQQGVTEVLEEQAQKEDDAATEAADDANAPASDFVGDTEQLYQKVDVDLTAMNADMVYATVYDMMSKPDSYVGKIIRMGGPCYHTYYEETDTTYFYVIIQDATACCSQGLEFVWGDGSHVYPDEYPADGTEVVVTGRFETYVEGSNAYAHLNNATLEAA